MFILNNKPLPIDCAFTINDIQYPSNWLRLSTIEEKNSLGITEVPDPVRADDRFYWDGNINNPKALEDKLETKEDGTPLYVLVYNPNTQQMEDTSEQVITRGLKYNTIQQVKSLANSMLQSTDWMIIRSIERNIPVPTEVVAERQSIINQANSIESAINAVTTVEELIALNKSIEVPK